MERARIVLTVAGGAGTSEAARQLGVSRPTVNKWRDRFASQGIAGLDDEPRAGRPKTIDDAAILAATLEPGRGPWPAMSTPPVLRCVS